MQSWPAVEVPRLPGQAAAPRLYDSAQGQLRPLALPGHTRVYVCGITPYDATHLGHAATYAAVDLLVRQLLDAGHRVELAQNITDVDDPLLERASATGERWEALASREIALYGKDMSALRILPPAHYIGVVEAIPLVVAMVERLEQAGATYRLDGDVYYPVAAAPRFGEVSRLERPAMLTLAAQRGTDVDRVGKKDPLDALLWRAQRPGEPAWDSPFGPGRPGWHVECAAIAVAYLGAGIDIQAGGSDLVFPHHELSAAHAQTATGQWPFARWYAHAGMVGLDGEKMSKSRGNLVLVSRLLAQGTEPAALRLALLAHHYRSDWQWDPGQLATAAARLARWREAVGLAHTPPAAPVLAELRHHLRDDLDSPGALRALDRWSQAALNREGRSAEGGAEVAEAVDALLGLRLRR